MSATTQVAIAKYPPRSRSNGTEIGSASTAHASTTSGTATNGSTPCCAKITTKNAPRPTYACCPTEISPAKPARRFHMLAIVSRMNAFTSVSVVLENTRKGRYASTRIRTAPAMTTPTIERRDRVTPIGASAAGSLTRAP